jgi:hypothetical protein
MNAFAHLIPGSPNADPVVDKIIGVESGGNPTAKNPRSSAAGPGQFIDATWAEFIQDRYPQLLNSGRDIYALKTDPNLGREATTWYKEKNSQFLQNKGLPVTPATVYLAHFAGPGGAESLLRADRNVPVSQVLGQKVVQANPHLRGLTVGDTLAWAEGKMGAEGQEVQVAQAGNAFEHLIPQENTFEHLIPKGDSGGEPPPPAVSLEPSTDDMAVGPAPAEGEVAAAPPPAAVPTGPEEGVQILDTLRRSRLRQRQNWLTAKLELGQIDPATAAKEYAQIMREQPEKRAVHLEAMKEWEARPEEEKGILGSLAWIAKYPGVTAELVGESSLQSLESAAGAIVGGIAGAPLGPAGIAGGVALGAGIPSAYNEYTGFLLGELEANGIDTKDEISLKGAFANPELMAKIRQRAATKGLVVGTFDGLTALIGVKGGGRLAVESLEKALGKEVVEKTAKRQIMEEGAATLLLVEAPGGMAGEAVGTLAIGDEIDWRDVMMEGVGEVMFSAPQVGVELAANRLMERNVDPATPEQIQQVVGAVTHVPTFEEAQIEGRTWYGFVPKDGSVSNVYKDYNEAEKEMGAVDARTGALVAVGPDSITATEVEVNNRLSRGEDIQPIFSDPGQESAARVLWDEYKAEKKGGKNYLDAVRMGLRITPVGDRKMALFVGDPKAHEILPKHELPLGRDVFKAVAKDPVGGGYSAVYFSPPSMNFARLAEDSRFTVSVTAKGIDAFLRNPRAEANAVALFETSPKAQQEIDQKGWKAYLDDLGKKSVEEIRGVFKAGDLKVRPAATWGVRIPTAPLLEISTDLDTAEAKAALESYAMEVPAPGVVEQAIQRPTDGPKLDFLRSDVTPKVPQTGKVSVFWASQNPDHAGLVKSVHAITERLLNALGIKHRVNFIFADSTTIHTLKNEFNDPNGDWQWIRNVFDAGGPLGRHNFAPNGDSLIIVDLGKSPISRLYKTAMHELGHAISYHSFVEAPAKLQGQIWAAYRRHMLFYRSKPENTRHFRARLSSDPVTRTFYDDYFLSFEEWFAEQTARWGQTSAKPLSAAARFFKRLARAIIASVRGAREVLGHTEDLKAEQVIQDWLDSVYSGGPKWGPLAERSFVEKTRAQNAKYGIDLPLQPESIRTHQVLDEFLDSKQLPPNTPPANARQHSSGAIKAQVDRFNSLLKWGINFRQLSQLNPHIAPLQRYTELVERMQITTNNIMAEAEEVVKGWQRLRRTKTAGRSQADRLADFLFDMTEMVYRTPNEVRAGVRRRPNQLEFEQLVKRHKLSGEALRLHTQIEYEFSKVVMRVEELSIAEAQRVFVNNPQQLQIAIARAQMTTRTLLQAPYFPMTRFGKWSVTIRSTGGGLEHFETFETQRDQKRALAEAERRYPPAQGWSVTASTLPEEAATFVGMPSWFLDKLGEMPGMTPLQAEWLELLRYEVAPVQSFRKHLIPRRKVAGYSRDAERVFAKYFFSHSRNYSRLKFGRDLDDQVKALRSEFAQTTPGVHDVNKRTRMADFLENHLKEIMNPGPDWHMLRSMTSVWFLGAVPASAALNASQLVLLTLPTLGARFGDAKAIAAMTRATRSLSTYYKRGSYEGQTNGEFVMLDYLIKQNLITESMAAELAGVAAGNSLDSYVGVGDKAKRGWLWFADKAMFMFKMIEQSNRRITARATYQLALAEPNNKWVQELKNKHFLEYSALMKDVRFNNESEVLAVLAAKEVILNTQFDYSKEARPRFVRGRKGLLFAFYQFTQNTVFQLLNPENKGIAVRYALIMMFLAGPMGLMPDDAEDLLNFVARRFFGKDFNLKVEARKFVNQLTHDPEWTDTILHGAGRNGFGIPAMMEMAGASWAPKVDFSRLIDLRYISPMPVTPILNMLDSSAKAEQQMSQYVQELAGAGFGLPFSFFKSMTDSELDLYDIKRWERSMPRAMKQMARAWRLGYEGGERVGRSNYVLEYDKHDPGDVAELVAIAGGFTPTRQAVQWDLSFAQREASMFWQAQRKGLLAAAFDAKFYYGSQEDWSNAIEEIKRFNKSVPDPTLKITADTIKKSLKARLNSQKEFAQGDGPGVPPILGRDIREQFPNVKRVSETPLPRGQ